MYQRCVAMSVGSPRFAVQMMSDTWGVTVRVTVAAVAAVPTLGQGGEACHRQS